MLLLYFRLLLLVFNAYNCPGSRDLWLILQYCPSARSNRPLLLKLHLLSILFIISFFIFVVVVVVVVLKGKRQYTFRANGKNVCRKAWLAAHSIS